MNIFLTVLHLIINLTLSLNIQFSPGVTMIRYSNKFIIFITLKGWKMLCIKVSAVNIINVLFCKLKSGMLQWICKFINVKPLLSTVNVFLIFSYIQLYHRLWKFYMYVLNWFGCFISFILVYMFLFVAWLLFTFGIF